MSLRIPFAHSQAKFLVMRRECRTTFLHTWFDGFSFCAYSVWLSSLQKLKK